MKKYLLISLFLVFLVFFLPWQQAQDIPQPEPPEQEDEPPVDSGSSEPNAPPAAEDPAAGPLDGARRITLLLDGTVLEMDLGTYLVGVVRAEMPASFALEALKAQAVAARTYTLYKMENGGSERHPDADTCADINCCKAYMSGEAAAALWGEQAQEYEEKIRRAVSETDGECILYEGKPLLAVFHSSSPGMTMDAQDVWSSALPYLVSVSSPEGSETVPNFHTSASFSLGALRATLLAALPQAQLTGPASNWFTDIRQHTSGTVTSLKVGGVEISGNRLRSILGLRSACFTLSFEGENVIFSVSGYGHGVGMSQYGANVLAQGGMDHREILTWYYTGSSVAVYRE